MKGLKLRTVVGLFFLVLCAAGVLVAHVWKQNAYVRLSMSSMKIGKARTRLQNDIALLEISVGSLKRLSRIEGMAKGRFGLEYGNTPVLVYLESDKDENKEGAATASAQAPEAVAKAGVNNHGHSPWLESRAYVPGLMGALAPLLSVGAALTGRSTGSLLKPKASASDARRSSAPTIETKGLEAGKVAWRIKGF